MKIHISTSRWVRRCFKSRYRDSTDILDAGLFCLNYTAQGTQSPSRGAFFAFGFVSLWNKGRFWSLVTRVFIWGSVLCETFSERSVCLLISSKKSRRETETDWELLANILSPHGHCIVWDSCISDHLLGSYLRFVSNTKLLSLFILQHSTHFIRGDI